DLAALGVDALEDALDGAVLAAGVHGLEDDQQAAPLLAVQPGLEVGDAGAVPLDPPAHVFFPPVGLGLVRVDVGQADAGAGLDPPARVVGRRRRVLDDRPFGVGDVAGLGGHPGRG